MDGHIKHLQGEMPPPEPGSVDIYASDKVGIFIPKLAMDFSESTHCHGGYEFVVPFATTSPFKVEKRRLIMEKNKLFPFNPEQAHRATVKTKDYILLALFVDKNFLQEISRSVYGQPKVVFENTGFTPDSNLQNLLRLFMEESRNLQSGHEFMLGCLSTQIAVYLLRQAQNNLSQMVTGRNITAKANINRAIDFLRESYYSEFSLAEIARVANLSPYHFSRVFKAETGKTPFEYLLDIKIERAQEMLRFSHHTVSEVCFSCGFNNLSHFTTVFKRKVGVTPSRYGKEFRGNKQR